MGLDPRGISAERLSVLTRVEEEAIHRVHDSTLEVEREVVQQLACVAGEP